MGSIDTLPTARGGKCVGMQAVNLMGLVPDSSETIVARLTGRGKIFSGKRVIFYRPILAQYLMKIRKYCPATVFS